MDEVHPGGRLALSQRVKNRVAVKQNRTTCSQLPSRGRLTQYLDRSRPPSPAQLP
jgi:hypothetical protein